MKVDYTFIYSVIAIALSWILVFVLWKDYRADALRHQIDALSGELSDFTSAGRLPFNHPARCLLAELLEDASGCADRLSLLRLLLCHLAWRNRPLPAEPWRRALDAVRDPDARAFLSDLHERLRLRLARHLALGSPLLFAITLARRRSAGDGSVFAGLPGLDRIECMLPSVWVGRSAGRADFSAAV